MAVLLGWTGGRKDGSAGTASAACLPATRVGRHGARDEAQNKKRLRERVRSRQALMPEQRADAGVGGCDLWLKG
jgi:hypothetical protein